MLSKIASLNQTRSHRLEISRTYSAGHYIRCIPFRSFPLRGNRGSAKMQIEGRQIDYSGVLDSLYIAHSLKQSFLKFAPARSVITLQPQIERNRECILW